MSGRVGPRLVGVVGIAWGVTLLAQTDLVWRRVSGHGPDGDERLLTQVLGTRHVVQGLTQVAAPRLTRRPAAAVDLVHAASMVALAVRRPEHSRPALASGGMALVAAAATLASGRDRP